MEDIKFEKVPSGIFDKVKSNKEQFVEKFIDDLEELFPDTVKDGKVDFQALLERFGEYQDRDEKYELTWVGKNKARQEAFEDIVGRTLKYVEEDSKNPETTENLYIEGDNLEVLKLLRKSYYGKIKMIYIDPPYNTGNDFIYKDNFAISKEEYETLKGDLDEYGNRLVKNNDSSGRYHSNWLNMMYPRLHVAKDLLTDDGVIFISIDDNEVHNMRKICDEIFGEENFVANLKWKRKKQPSFLSRVAGVMEYILIYAKKVKEIDKLAVEELSDSDKPIVNSSNPVSKRSFKKGIRVKSKLDKIKAGTYKNRTITTEYLDDVIIKNGRAVNDFSIRSKFRTTQSELDKFIEQDLIFITSNLGLRRNLTIKEKSNKKSITDLLLDWGQNQDATTETKELFCLNQDKNIFDNPKPVLLIKNLIKSNYATSDFIVLDFFSGSATTAHAVMDLNAEDGGNRKFIMVQLPEPTDEKSVAYKEGYENICEIGKERIRRAGDKILEENKDKEGIENLDIGFKVFRVDDTNFRRIKEGKVEDLETRYKSLTPKEEKDFNRHFTDIDVVYELMLRRQDIELTEEVKKLDYIGDRTYMVGNTMLVCLEEEISEDTIEKIGTIDADLSWIVLRDSAFEDNCELKINTANKLRSIIKSSRNKNQKIYWI